MILRIYSHINLIEGDDVICTMLCVNIIHAYWEHFQEHINLEAKLTTAQFSHELRKYDLVITSFSI